MILMKDYATRKSSFTFTGTVLTFVLTVMSVIINFVLMWNGKDPFPEMTWSCIGLFSIFAGLYWNKRFRANSDGIELVGNNDNIVSNK